MISEKSDTYRTAAYRGMILSSGHRAPRLITTAILGTDEASQTAALQLVREVDAPNATQTFSLLLHRVRPPVQVALLEGLTQRGDVSAASTIVVMDRSPSLEVRLAAINALGILGDDTMVPLLGVAAISTNAVEQKAARLALVQLHHGKPTDTLLRLLPNAKPEVQAEFALALGGRGDKTAVPRLVALARDGVGSARKAALQALALLVDDPQLGVMVQFVTDAKTEADRAEAAEALNSACQQILSRRGKVNVEPLCSRWPMPPATPVSLCSPFAAGSSIQRCAQPCEPRSPPRNRRFTPQQCARCATPATPNSFPMC